MPGTTGGGGGGPRFGFARVRGPSMVPALRDGDRLLVDYRAGAGVGRVVVARRPDRPATLIVKRAVRRVDGGWWLLGDNPYAPDDSRVFGAVPDALVLGRAVVRLRGPRGLREAGGRPLTRL